MKNNLNILDLNKFKLIALLGLLIFVNKQTIISMTSNQSYLQKLTNQYLVAHHSSSLNQKNSLPVAHSVEEQKYYHNLIHKHGVLYSERFGNEALLFRLLNVVN